MSKFGLREEPGNRLVYRRMEDFSNDAKQVFRNGFFSFMKELKRNANKEILRKPKGGESRIIRTAGGRRRRHVASAPGESHANVTGTLRKSLSWKVKSWHTAEFGYGVASNASSKAPVYGRFLELGTRAMRARPSLRNAVFSTKMDPHFDKALSQFVRKFR